MEWKPRHRIIVTTVFLSLNLGGAKVNSAFDLCEIGEFSSGVFNAVQVCRGCADHQGTLTATVRKQLRLVHPAE